MRNESLQSSAIQKRNVSAAAQSSFPYITKGQPGLKIFFSVELLHLHGLLFICMGVWGLYGLNFSRTTQNFNSCSPFPPSCFLSESDRLINYCESKWAVLT